MGVKWVLYWHPGLGTQVTTQTLMDLVKSIESMNGVRAGRWQVTASQHRPFQQNQAIPIESARDLLGVSFSDVLTKHYYVLRSDHMVVEADSSIKELMEKLQMYKSRLSMSFEGYQYQLGDFQLKAGRALLSPSENYRGIVLEVEYLPLSSVEKSRLVLQEFVDLWQDVISGQSLSGRLTVVETNFADFALPDTYTWQHTALQYTNLFTHFMMSQNQRL